MNEKIKLLADEARAWVNDTNNVAPDIEYVFYKDAYDKKFAELIVRECSRVIVNGGYWSGGPIGPKRQCTPPEIAQMIKEYFGVEE